MGLREIFYKDWNPFSRLTDDELFDLLEEVYQDGVKDGMRYEKLARKKNNEKRQQEQVSRRTALLTDKQKNEILDLRDLLGHDVSNEWDDAVISAMTQNEADKEIKILRKVAGRRRSDDFRMGF